MAIILKSKIYKEIMIDSHIINGVLGNDYDDFLESLSGKSVYYLNRDGKNIETLDKDDKYSKLLNLENVLEKDYASLSHSEKKLIKYYLMVKSNSKIMIINEPYLDLDYKEKKCINNLFNILIKEGKTIIIASHNTNIIYQLCKKVILVNKQDLYYDSVKILTKHNVLEKYHLNVPDIVKFIDLAKKKNIKIPYSKDIRDLIKDVYRNVSSR